MRYLAERFPQATIVFPHLGPSRAEIFERISIVAKHPNMYLEISGSGVERVGILEKAVKEIGSERVLYGSDFTINEPSAVIARVKNAFLTAEERNNILFRNLEKLLKRAG
jgi:predicted TIM-barrel fold metal-dependent hydrolase